MVGENSFAFHNALSKQRLHYTASDIVSSLLIHWNRFMIRLYFVLALKFYWLRLAMSLVRTAAAAAAR